MYFIVKETMTITRFYFVDGDKDKVIQDVKDCKNNALYLESCDELHWEDEIEYKIEELKDDWQKDLRLRGAARHIQERLSEKPPEIPLTKRGRKRKMK